MELRNQSQLEFIDISSEKWRNYITPVGTYSIHDPKYLAVTENGHRVLDSNGVSHYIDISKGFFLSWEAKEGKPHFIK